MLIDRLSLLIGKRTIKTALAVFVTALVCNLLNWPVIFAVLAALVSIEPTVNASIQKAKIRLPAAVVGAGFAMLFVWLFDQTPLAYALSVLFTIAVCHRLRWEDAIVVAALTSLNMLVLTEDHFLKNFIIRVGTTSLGIVVSVAVNYLVFPPYFAGLIKEFQPKLLDSCRKLLANTIQWHLDGNEDGERLKKDFAYLMKRIDKSNRLVHYQYEEFRYHRFKLKEYREMHMLQRQLEFLQQVLFHIGAIVHMKNKRHELTEEERNFIWEAGTVLDQCFAFSEQDQASRQRLKLKMSQLKQLLQDDQSEHELLDFRSVLAYELLAIYFLIEQRIGHNNVMFGSLKTK